VATEVGVVSLSGWKRPRQRPFPRRRMLQPPPCGIRQQPRRRQDRMNRMP